MEMICCEGYSFLWLIKSLTNISGFGYFSIIIWLNTRIWWKPLAWVLVELNS